MRDGRADRVGSVVVGAFDQRAKRVELTPEGRKLRRRLEKRLVASRPSIVGLSEAEGRQLRDLIRKAMDGV